MIIRCLFVHYLSSLVHRSGLFVLFFGREDACTIGKMTNRIVISLTCILLMIMTREFVVHMMRMGCSFQGITTNFISCYCYCYCYS